MLVESCGVTLQLVEGHLTGFVVCVGFSSFIPFSDLFKETLIGVR